MLNDKEWHSYAETVRALVKVIPPGIGMRRAEHLASRNKSDPDDPRHVHHDPPELIEIGRRHIAAELLRNHRVYEIKGDGPGRARQPGWIDQRQVRMIGTSHWLQPMSPVLLERNERRYQAQLERNRLTQENERLRDRVANLRIYLIGLGHEERANEIAPPDED